MLPTSPSFRLRNIATCTAVLASLTSCLIFDGLNKREGIAGPSMMEFRWDNTGNYKRLYYTQSASEKRERSTYYLVMKGKDRKTAILKLTINLPKYFDSSIKPKNLKLCKIQLGGMLEKTRCKETIPAVFEVSKDSKSINVFPNNPIPSDKDSYALKMKIFNPTQAGMHQLNAMTQSPGDLPVSVYIGSWNIDIR